MKRIKKYILLLLATLLLLSPISLFAKRHEKKDIQLPIIVNDHYVMSDVHPFIEKDRTYVPIRFIAEELGYDVTWDGIRKEVHITDGKSKVQLAIESKVMTIDGKDVILDAPAKLKDDRTFVPLRAIAEAFGEKVNWSQDYQTVFIGNDPKYNEFYPIVFYYGNEAPVISTYTMNIVTYKINVGGDIKGFQGLSDLVNTVEQDFTTYYKNGKSNYGIKEYRPGKETPTPKKEFVSNVEKDRQLKDDQYISWDANDPIVGSWYGPSEHTTSDGKIYKTYAYLYITPVGKQQYLLKKRVILPSDSSEFYTEQYGTYDPATGILSIARSNKTYGATGYFVNQNPYSYGGDLILEQNGRHFSWNEPNSTNIYFDKY